MSKFVFALATILAINFAARPIAAQATPKAKLYNTAKQKLLDGKQVFTFTQDTFDVAGYCEKAKHYDYTWFEMQHSTLEFRDVEKMIAGCPGAPAIPMIRLPDAQEFHIQHATDLGALGVIIPTVDTVERAPRSRQLVSLSTRGSPQRRRGPGSQCLRKIWPLPANLQ